MTIGCNIDALLLEFNKRRLQIACVQQLFNRAVAWLITSKVMLPGSAVLERQAVKIRNRAQLRVWSLLVQGIPAETAGKVEALLRFPHGGQFSKGLTLAVILDSIESTKNEVIL